MNTDLQPEIEILPEINSDRVNDLSDEAGRLHDAAVESYRGGRPDETGGLFRRSLALFEQAEGVGTENAIRDLQAGISPDR